MKRSEMYKSQVRSKNNSIIFIEIENVNVKRKKVKEKN